MPRRVYENNRKMIGQRGRRLEQEHAGTLNLSEMNTSNIRQWMRNCDRLRTVMSRLITGRVSAY